MIEFFGISIFVFLFWGLLSQSKCNRKAEGRIIPELSGDNFTCESKVGSHLPKR